MTWILYHQHVESLTGPAKRQFLNMAEDWAGLREFDRANMKETDLGTGTV